MSNDDKKQKAAELAERTSQWEAGHARGIGVGLAMALVASGDVLVDTTARRDIHGVAQRRGGETLDAFQRECAKRGILL